MIASHVLESMRASAEVFPEWPQQVRAALATMLHFLSVEPELARVYALEPIAAGGELAARHREAMQGLIDILKAGRPADTPLTPGDLCATVHHCTGLTSEQITGMGLTPAGRVIDELF